MTTTLTEQSVVDVNVADAFARFGSPLTRSWLFNAHCDDVRVGAAVSLRLPLSHGGGRHAIDLLGRISTVRHNALITIEFTQPWRGRLSLRFVAAGMYRTQVRLSLDVPEAGLQWLMRRSGVYQQTIEEDGDTVRIGLITSKSGPAAIFAMAAESMAQLAVAEVNANGGLAGRSLQLVVADDATDPARAAEEARRLLRLGCRAIFAVTTSVSFAAVHATVGSEVLLVHAVTNERSPGDGPTVVRMGESPVAQLDALTKTVMRASGARGWYLVGVGYSWSYRSHFAARRAIARDGGRVLGESYTPLGTSDFTTVIEGIQRSGADLVLSTLNGADELAFQRQSLALGLRAQTHTVSLVLDEATLEHLGTEAAEGIWTATGYLQAGPAQGNRELVERYAATFGQWAPPVSSLTETVYEVIVHYARALHAEGAGASPARQARLLRARAGAGRGQGIGQRDLLRPPLYVARARAGAWQIVEHTA